MNLFMASISYACPSGEKNTDVVLIVDAPSMYFLSEIKRRFSAGVFAFAFLIALSSISNEPATVRARERASIARNMSGTVTMARGLSPGSFAVKVRPICSYVSSLVAET